MTPPRGRNLALRLVAEFAVIVVGVLVALAVDAWTGRVADDRREIETLVSLRDDLRASADDLRRDSRITEERVAVLNWFLTFPIDGAAAFPIDSLQRVSRAVNITSAYSPILRTYQALVATGELGLIEDRAIQFGLAQLQKESDEYLDYRRQTTDGWLFALKLVWNRWIGESGEFGTLLPPPPVLGALRDREFRGVIAHRRTFLMFTGRQGMALADRMDEIVELIEAELAGRDD